MAKQGHGQELQKVPFYADIITNTVKVAESQIALREKVPRGASTKLGQPEECRKLGSIFNLLRNLAAPDYNIMATINVDLIQSGVEI